MLVALGDGGTTELAERALEYLDGLLADQQAAGVRAEMVAPELEIGGVAEVTRALGVSRQTVGHWLAGRRQPPFPFPEPTWVLDATPVWNMALIRQLTVTEPEVKTDAHA
jgi:hypothetical protein